MIQYVYYLGLIKFTCLYRWKSYYFVYQRREFRNKLTNWLAQGEPRCPIHKICLFFSSHQGEQKCSLSFPITLNSLPFSCKLFCDPHRINFARRDPLSARLQPVRPTHISGKWKRGTASILISTQHLVKKESRQRVVEGGEEGLNVTQICMYMD